MTMIAPLLCFASLLLLNLIFQWLKQVNTMHDTQLRADAQLRRENQAQSKDTLKLQQVLDAQGGEIKDKGFSKEAINRLKDEEKRKKK